MDKPIFDKARLYNELGKEKLRKYLNGIIDGEMKKSDSEMDADKISECADWILELDEITVSIPKEKIAALAKSAADTYYKPKKRWIAFFRVSAACAAVLLAVQIASVSVFKTNFFKAAYELAANTVQSDLDETKRYKLIHTYDTIKEFKDDIQNEMQVPEYMPCSPDVDTVKYSYDDRIVDVGFVGGAKLSVNFDSSDIPADIIKNSEKYTYEDVDYYLHKDSKTLFWVWEDSVHAMVCEEMPEQYEEIIKSLK